MAQRPIVLLAASGLAGEVMELLALTNRGVSAILDDDSTLHGTTVMGIPIAGPIASVADQPDVDVVICAGSGVARRAIAQALTRAGVAPERFVSLVHPTASIGSTCSIGWGSVVLAQASATARVSIGPHVVVMPNAVLTHDCVVEQFATICAGATLGGTVRVAEGAYIGMNASIRQKVRVGAWSTLGMGSALLNNLPDGATWGGIPAAPIRSGAQAGSSIGRNHHKPAQSTLQ